jgi:hypothetical protein
VSVKAEARKQQVAARAAQLKEDAKASARQAKLDAEDSKKRDKKEKEFWQAQEAKEKAAAKAKAAEKSRARGEVSQPPQQQPQPPRARAATTGRAPSSGRSSGGSSYAQEHGGSSSAAHGDGPSPMDELMAMADAAEKSASKAPKPKSRGLMFDPFSGSNSRHDVNDAPSRIRQGHRAAASEPRSGHLSSSSSCSQALPSWAVSGQDILENSDHQAKKRSSSISKIIAGAAFLGRRHSQGREGGSQERRKESSGHAISDVFAAKFLNHAAVESGGGGGGEEEPENPQAAADRGTFL